MVYKDSKVTKDIKEILVLREIKGLKDLEETKVYWV